jgi:ferrochelatase
VDCLETLEEIDQEARAAFLNHGGTSFEYIPCLNATPAGIDVLSQLAQQHLTDWLAPQSTTPEKTQALAFESGAKN